MNSKKAITLLLIATMLLSITPVIVSNAITVDDIYVDGGPLPAEVYYGDTIIVEGSAATPSRDVKIYWDGIDELLNTTKAKGNGEWLVWFDVPDATYGAHYITVENVRNGDIYTLVSTPIMVGASLSVSPKAGLKGDTVTIKGHGFGDEVDVTIIDFNAVDLTTTPTTPTTNDVGYWTATFSVPIEAYGTYPVYAEDEDGHSASKDFKVGAAITLNKDSGPSGTVVRVTGRGFTPGAYINDTSVILLDTVECGLVTKNAKVKTNGEFVLDLVIPDVGEDEWTLSIQEWGGDDISATADFEQTGRPAIELTPEYGPVGGTITVKGYNFTQINGEDVDIELAGSGSIKTVETNSMGEFTATYRIPGASGTPDIVASQDKFNLEASAKFRVGFITVVIYPEECTAGERVTVSGSGFDELQTCNVTLDGDLWMDELDVGPGGVISETEYVPSMPAGVYDVVVTESDSGISVTVELTITENTYVTTSPMVAPPGYEVDIEGHNFAYDAVANNVETLTFVLYNETTEWSLSVEYDGATVALGDDADWDEGYFEGTFMLPDEDSISIGSYMINVTDGADMHAQIAFDIVDKTVDIEPKEDCFQSR